MEVAMALTTALVTALTTTVAKAVATVLATSISIAGRMTMTPAVATWRGFLYG